MQFIPVISKLIFLASLIQSHDPSEIILIFRFAAKKIMIIIMLKTAEEIFFKFLWWIGSS